MIRCLVDQNFNDHIIDGLTRRDPSIDFIHVRDIGFAEADDPIVLEWAASDNRVLLTHDRKTIPPFAYARVAAGQPMAGVFLVHNKLPVGQAIEDLLTAFHCLSQAECEGVVTYFPT